MIKNNLSMIMGAKRINIMELSKMSNLHYQTVYALYHDRSKGVEFETLNKLCWALECSPNDIFQYIEDTI